MTFSFSSMFSLLSHTQENMDETEKPTIKNGQLLRIYSWFFLIS